MSLPTVESFQFVHEKFGLTCVLQVGVHQMITYLIFHMITYLILSDQIRCEHGREQLFSNVKILRLRILDSGYSVPKYYIV